MKNASSSGRTTTKKERIYMIINTEEIKMLLKENTAYKLGKELNVSRQNLNNYKNGTYSIDKMTIELATKLQKYYRDN